MNKRPNKAANPTAKPRLASANEEYGALQIQGCLMK